MDFIFVGAANAWEYIKRDWHSNRVRFCAEVFAWACSVVWCHFIVFLLLDVVQAPGLAGPDGVLA